MSRKSATPTSTSPGLGPAVPASRSASSSRPNRFSKNHLLAVLPKVESARLLPHLQPVSLPLGEALYESGAQLDFVYFPTTAIVSLLYELENGASAEIAVVGNEGIVGIALFMGGGTMPNRAVVQSEGPGPSAARAAAKAGVRSRGRPAASPPALHPGPADPDGPDRRLQPPPHRGPATVPMAAPEPGPVAGAGIEHDAGADRQHAGRAARRGDRGRRQAPEKRAHPVQSRADHGARSAGPGGPSVRVLRGGAQGVRPPAARTWAWSRGHRSPLAGRATQAHRLREPLCATAPSKGRFPGIMAP